MQQQQAVNPPPSPSSSPGDSPTKGAPRKEPVDKGVFKVTRASARIAILFGALDDEQRSALYQALESARLRCATAANALVRDMQREDERNLDAFLLEHGRLPQKSKELPPPKRQSWGYQLVRKVQPELHSKIASAIAKMASKKYQQSRWEALVLQRTRPLRYTRRLPIPVPSQDWAKRTRLLHDERTGHWDLVVAFEAGKAMRLPLKIKGSHLNRVLTRIRDYIEGDPDGYKPGELKIEQDYRRPGRWYVRLAYTRLVPKREDGKSAAFHRGIRNMFVLVTEDGDQLIDEGRDVEAYLAQMQARRKSYQRQSKLAGRKGRGRKHILRPTEKLAGKASRWRQTRAQTAARRAAEWLASRGVSRVYVEDLTGLRHGEPEALEGGERVWKRIQSYPIYDHGMRFRACCEESGIEVIDLSAHYHSQRCPRCHRVDESHRDLRHWRLRCGNESCGFNRDLDVGAALNALARGEAKRLGQPSDFDDLPKPPRTTRGGARKSPRKARKKKTKSGARRKSKRSRD